MKILAATVLSQLLLNATGLSEFHSSQFWKQQHEFRKWSSDLCTVINCDESCAIKFYNGNSQLMLIRLLLASLLLLLVE